MKRHTTAVLAAFALAAALPLAANAGGKPSAAAKAGCTVSGNVVTATGLPTDQLVNFLVSDASGTRGWVLGYTWDGTFSVSVPAQNGPTSYKFVSKTWGPSGSKYNVFAAC